MKTPISIVILCAFLLNTFGPLPAQAQELLLPKPGVRVALSPAFNPPVLKGIKVHPDNPFRFDFILDKGTDANSAVRPILGQELGSVPKNEALKEEANKLIKYFLASLTVPEKDLWVNLSPYEKDRIVPQSFGLTEMGRDLLAQDYLLKQITASLIYPEDEFGKKFWNRVYEEAAKKFGTTNIPVNTFNKVWIVPEKAVVYENAQAGTAYVVESKLKVMLEQDYLALDKNTIPSPSAGRAREGGDVNALGSQIVREIVIPQLTKEINENKNFAQLRQVYNSLILATWYKKKIRDSILNKVYADRNKVNGLSSLNSVIPAKAGIQNTGDIEGIYQRYLTAFKKGVYNYIKEDVDPVSQQIVPRKYFSGGVLFSLDSAQASGHTDMALNAFQVTSDPALAANALPSVDQAMQVTVDAKPAGVDSFSGLAAVRPGGRVNVRNASRDEAMAITPKDAVTPEQVEEILRSLDQKMEFELLYTFGRERITRIVAIFIGALEVKEFDQLFDEVMALHNILPIKERDRENRVLFLLESLSPLFKKGNHQEIFSKMSNLIAKWHETGASTGDLSETIGYLAPHMNNQNYQTIFVQLPELYKSYTSLPQKGGSLRNLFQYAPQMLNEANLSDVLSKLEALMSVWQERGGTQLIWVVIRQASPFLTADNYKAIFLRLENLLPLFENEDDLRSVLNTIPFILIADDYQNISLEWAELKKQWSARGWTPESLTDTLSDLFNVIKQANYKEVFSDAIELYGNWKAAGAEENDTSGILSGVAGILTPENYKDILSKMPELVKAWKALDGSEEDLMQFLARLESQGILTATNYQSVFQEFLNFLRNWSEAGGNITVLKDIFDVWRDGFIELSPENYVQIFEDFPEMLKGWSFIAGTVIRHTNPLRDFKDNLREIASYSEENVDLREFQVLNQKWHDAGGSTAGLAVVLESFSEGGREKGLDKQNYQIIFEALPDLLRDWQIAGGSEQELAKIISKIYWIFSPSHQSDVLGKPAEQTYYTDVFSRLPIFLSLWKGTGGDVETLINAVNSTPWGLDETSYQDYFSQILELYKQWKENGWDTQHFIPALNKISELLTPNNHKEVFGKLSALWKEWASARNSREDLDAIFDGIAHMVGTLERYEDVLPRISPLFLGWKTTGGDVKTLSALLGHINKSFIVTLKDGSYEELFGVIASGRDATFRYFMNLSHDERYFKEYQTAFLTLFSQTFPKKLALELFDKLKEMDLGPVKFLEEGNHTGLFAKYTGLNIKLVRNLAKHGGWSRLRDEEFRETINKMSIQFNREKTWHPAARRMGEDEKEEILKYLFQEGVNYKRAKEVFDQFFYNAPALYAIKINDINRLLEHLSMEDLRIVIQLVKEDPKQSLEEIKDRLKVKLNEENLRRTSDEKKLDVEDIMREFPFIASNLFVLDEQMESLQTIMAHFKTTQEIVGFLTELDASAKFVDVIAVAKKWNVPVGETVLLKINSIAKIKTREGFVGNVLQGLKEHGWDSAYVGMGANLQSFSRKSLGRIYGELEKKGAFKKDLNLKNIFPNIEISSEKTEGSDIESIVLEEDGQVPHIFFESMVRLGLSDESIEKFRTITRAMGTQKFASAGLKNTLYESTALFSIMDHEDKARLFSGIMDVVFAWHGNPNRENIQDIHKDMRMLLRVVERAATFDHWSQGIVSSDVDMVEMAQDARNIIDNILDGRAVDKNKDILRFSYKASKLSVQGLVAAFKEKEIEVTGEDKDSLVQYFDEKIQWSDHENRGLTDLLSIYVSRPISSQVAQVMYASLVAEATGNFAKWKFESPDYLEFLSGVIDYFVDALPMEQKKAIQDILAPVEVQNRFEIFMKIEGYGELKDQVLKVKNAWESILSMSFGDGKKAQFTHEYGLLLNIGNYKGSTACQTVANSSTINEGLAGYVGNGTVKAVTFVNDKEQVVDTRRIVKLLMVEVDGKKQPAIFVEESTQFGVDGLEDLYALIDELSRRSGLPVVTSTARAAQVLQDKRGEPKLVTFFITEGRSRSYSDAFGSANTGVATMPVRIPGKDETPDKRIIAKDLAGDVIQSVTKDSTAVVGVDRASVAQAPNKIEQLFDLKMAVLGPQTSEQEIAQAEHSSDIQMVRIVNPTPQQVQALQSKGYFYKPAKIVYHMDLPRGDGVEDAMEQYYARFSSKQRNQFKTDVRKIDEALERGDLRLVDSNEEPDAIDDFLKLYQTLIGSKERGRLPLIEAIEESRLSPKDFINQGRLGLYLKDRSGNLVGGMIVRRFSNRYSISYAATDRKAGFRSLQFYLMQNVMRRSIAEGLQTIAYGVDRNLYGHHLSTGLMQSKINSGFHPEMQRNLSASLTSSRLHDYF